MDLVTALEVCLVVLALAFLSWIVVVVARRLWLSRQGGVFECGLRDLDSDRGWMLGLARYLGDRLAWYPGFSLSVRPRFLLPQTQTSVVGHRDLDDLETLTLYPDHVAVGLRVRPETAPARQLELSMSRESLTGLMSWLEATPPGGRSYRERD